MRIDQDSWNIIQRVLRRYPDNLKEQEAGGAYRERIEREIKAVELALSMLSPEEQEVIRARFFQDRHRNVSYERIFELGYSARQMRRITHRMVEMTGRALGEIR